MTQKFKIRKFLDAVNLKFGDKKLRIKGYKTIKTIDIVFKQLLQQNLRIQKLQICNY